MNDDDELADLDDMAEMFAMEVAYFHGIWERSTENSVLSPASCGQMARLLERALAAAARLRELSAEVERLRALLARLVDPDPCRYDHHGLCQAHSLESPCPHAEAKAALGEDR